MSQRFTWKKAEKLKSRKQIERVFREGKSFSLFPYRVHFLLQQPATVVSASPGASEPAPSVSLAAGASTPAPPVLRSTGAKTLPSPLQAGFGASSRHFKKAVDRNRIKRLGREAYRLQKEPLLRRLTEKGFSMAVFFIYTGKELPGHATVTEKIGVALEKLIKGIT